MPTFLTWTYVGDHATVREATAVDGDVQRIKAGEIGVDDVLGDVTILSFEGGDLTIETGERDADGKLVQRKRAAGHIRAKVNEPGMRTCESVDNTFERFPLPDPPHNCTHCIHVSSVPGSTLVNV